MAVIIVIAALVMWAAALSVLWGWSIDPSGSTSLAAVGWSLIAAWWMLRRRGRWGSRAVRWVARLGLDEAIPLAAALRDELGSSKEDVKRRMRLFSAGAIAAMACMLGATGVVLASRLGALLLGEWFLFSNATWRVLETLALLLGGAGVGAAMVCVFYTSSVVRASGGRDTYASISRDWPVAVACGLGGFAVAWWFGANLIYVLFALAGGILLVSLTAVSRGDLSTHPRKKLLPFGPPSRWALWSLAAAYALVAVVLVGQGRLLGDVLGLSFTRRLLWWGLSLVLLAYFLGRFDRKGRSAGRLQIVGSMLGVGAALLAQATELTLCLALDGASSVIATCLAVATQVPCASLVATVLSSQRREFAAAGGSVGRYLQAVAGGLAGACVLLGLAGWLGMTGLAMLILAGVLTAAGGAGGAIAARRRPDRIAWLAWTVVLVGAFGGGFLVAVARAAPVLRDPAAGVWLTSVNRRDRMFREVVQMGTLPAGGVRRSERVTDCIAEAFRRRKGRWWQVCTDARDLPARAPRGEFDPVYARCFIVGSNPEPAPVGSRWDCWPIVTGTASHFLRYARLNYVAATGYDYYEGVLLAPLPADHPQAWRCYNELTLRRCRRTTELIEYERDPQTQTIEPVMHHGLMMLRTQASRGRVRQALRVARTFDEAVSSGRRVGQRDYHVESPGWAIVALRVEGLDMLLVGPVDATGSPDEPSSLLAAMQEIVADDYDTFVLPIRRLWPGWKDISPIYLFNPPGERLSGTPSLEGFREHLELIDARYNDRR
jgi:hypothetical protein